ncbi:GvpL/GvpF family gas vesicle protein [Streptomyces phyllanthi]|uniref:GvpL/GvpF family gas vesicle protein n=1 Tax=Streptomyces phyllanthi TaxID=1803180 RepID=A0A5N8W7N7_9ACTN|nr:GvpL/GvpF family gas vesicle protein [Streptomyces phyllanthi]MPY43487.1 GvpL/GvpF family gas vesicle protein [Streptomyces phyllanthi]
MTAAGPYVYGIVACDHPMPAELRGVGRPQAALELLPVGATAAVISAAPVPLRARRRDLLAHQEVLLTLALDGPVLPMRFGMLAPDADTVREQLEAGHEQNLRALDRLAGRVEMNVKALPATGALAALVAEEPHIRRLREATQRRPSYEANVRLGEAVVHTLARRAADAAQELQPELAALAVARSTGPHVTGTVLNMSFLVARQDTVAFRAAVDRLSATHRDRVELRVAGPLPCYSFTEPEVAAAATARRGG